MSYQTDHSILKKHPLWQILFMNTFQISKNIANSSKHILQFFLTQNAFKNQLPRAADHLYGDTTIHLFSSQGWAHYDIVLALFSWLTWIFEIAFESSNFPESYMEPISISAPPLTGIIPLLRYRFPSSLEEVKLVWLISFHHFSCLRKILQVLHGDSPNSFSFSF